MGKEFLPDSAKPAANLAIGNHAISSLPELLRYLGTAEDPLPEETKKSIYLWLRDSLRDPVLARLIRKVKYKKNLLEQVSKRIAHKANVANGTETDSIQVNLSLYTTREKLVLDREKCIKCEISHKACPKEAVLLEGGEIILNKKCVLCGVCVPFCPTGALTLEGNDEAKTLTKKANPAPELPPPEDVNGVKIRRIFDGVLSIDDSKCPADCEYCVSACPTGALERDGAHVSVEKDECVYCGACSNACPKGAIEIKRNRIFCKGEFSAIHSKTIEIFLGKEKQNVIQNQGSLKKIKGLVSGKEFAEYM